MLILFCVFTLMCSAALAADSIDPDQLNHAMQVGIAEMATIERARLHEVGITDLTTFVPSMCKFIEIDRYLCMAIARGKMQSDSDNYVYDVLITVPIIGVIQGNQVIKFVVENVQIKVIDSSAFLPLAQFGTRPSLKSHVAHYVNLATKTIKFKGKLQFLT